MEDKGRERERVRNIKEDKSREVPLTMGGKEMDRCPLTVTP
jgi:hypothetical protein